MKIIGLTGGIGSGKSTVLNLFKELGITTYMADNEAKNLMNSDLELVGNIIKLFGEQAFQDQKLDNKFIASIVFSDKAKLKALNDLVHPKVREHFNLFIHKLNSDLIIYEAAILFESGSAQRCDYVITVIADEDDKIQRIMNRDGLTKEQILSRMKNQLEDAVKIKKADFVIYNKDLPGTKDQILSIFDIIKKL